MTTPEEVVRALAQRMGSELGPEALEAEIAQAESPTPPYEPVPDTPEPEPVLPSSVGSDLLSDLESLSNHETED